MDFYSLFATQWKDSEEFFILLRTPVKNVRQWMAEERSVCVVCRAEPIKMFYLLFIKNKIEDK